MDRTFGHRASRRTLIVAAAGAMVTLLVLLAPSVRLGYRSVGGHIVLETTATLTGGLVALLLYTRYRRTHHLRELLLVCAMALLSLTALVVATRPSLFSDGDDVAAGIWAAPGARLVGAVLILAAALVPSDLVHRVTHPVRDMVGIGAALAVPGLIIMVLDRRLPGLVDVRSAVGDGGHLTIDSHPLVIALQLLTLPCYAIAALSFTREAARDGDDLVGWFGAAAALGSWVLVNYLFFPTIYTEWLSLGDLLRLGFFVLLLVGAVREMQHYWAAQTVAAAESERRRLARDLHDGVVQELGYIRSRILRADGPHEALAAEILAAADRAVDEARRSIDGLIAHPDEDLSAVLERAAVEVGDRYGVAVHLLLETDVSVTPARREALVRIVREAVSNAARHAAPDGVWITLAGRELTVFDDGQGFGPTAQLGRGGFGLIGMQERAACVGAVVEITSAQGTGTTVRATW